MIPKKRVLILVLLLLGVLIPLIISPCMIKSVKEGLAKYYANVNEYFDDVNQNLGQLDNIYNDIVDGSKSQFPLSDYYKKQKMTAVIKLMNDWKKYKYKTNLLKIIESVITADDAAIMKTVMDKVATIKQEIASEKTST